MYVDADGILTGDSSLNVGSMTNLVNLTNDTDGMYDVKLAIEYADNMSRTVKNVYVLEAYARDLVADPNNIVGTGTDRSEPLVPTT